MTYYARLFALDGDHVIDFHQTESIDEVWERVNDMGSRWIFYPLPFVFSSENLLVSTPEFPFSLDFMEGYTHEQTKEFVIANQEMFEAFLDC